MEAKTIKEHFDSLENKLQELQRYVNIAVELKESINDELLSMGIDLKSALKDSDDITDITITTKVNNVVENLEECGICSTIFSTRSELNEHLLQKHLQDFQLVSGELNERLKEHLNDDSINRSEEEKENTNSTLSKNLEDKSDNNILSNPESLNTVKETTAELPNNSDLNSEDSNKQKNNTNSEEKSDNILNSNLSVMTYSCDKCGKQYKKKAGLIQHMRKHTGTLPKCPVCFLVLSGLPALTKHKGRKHPTLFPELHLKYGKKQ